MEIKVLIGLICTILGGILGYLSFRRNEKLDIKQDTKEDTKQKVELNTKLDILLTNNGELKSSFKELDKKLDVFKDDVNIRLTRVEENTKLLEKRVDNVERR